MNIKDNLLFLMGVDDLSQTEVARRSGLKQATINRLIHGVHATPDTKTIMALANCFGVTIDALLNEDIAKHWDDDAPKTPPATIDEFEDLTPPTIHSTRQQRFKIIPIVGYVQGGDNGFLEEITYPVGFGDGEVEYPARDPNAYAVRVKGDSMHPRIRNGEVVVVEPNKVAVSGDDVVVRCHDGRKMIKELAYQRDGYYTFNSINSDHTTLRIPVSDVDTIHLVSAIIPSGSPLKR